MRSLADDVTTAWHLQCPFAPTVALAPDHFRSMIRLELGLGPTPNGDPRRLHAIMNSRHGNQGGSRTRIHDDVAKFLKQAAKSCDSMIAELEVRNRLNYDHGGPARPDLILNDAGHGILTDRRDHPNGIAVDVVTAHPIHSDANICKATARTKGKAATDAFNGIEVGGRMHAYFYQLLDTFAKLKADGDAGPLDDDTDPAKAKYHKAFLARAKTAFVSRIQVARVKCVAERIMLITRTAHGRPIGGRARTPYVTMHTRRLTAEEN
jgi:hypothetical protein